ncbi:MAG: adenylyl-sulfate kinase [bacterium]
MTTHNANNITWHKAAVTTEDRAILNKHSGAVLWFTGLSASGKSTLAVALEKLLFNQGCRTYVLDGDNIRCGLNANLDFSPGDRKENIRRIAEVAKLFVDAGVIVMTAFISPYAGDRESARQLLPSGKFIEIYCKCPINICEQRDPKGLYKKARAGQLKEFTGIDAPYEAPASPEITADTGSKSTEENARTIVDYLRKQGLISTG